MQKTDHGPDEEEAKRCSSSRRNSSQSRRGSLKEEGKKTGTSSTTSTPRRVPKAQNFDFLVTGKQICNRGDRANSLPGAQQRRSSAEMLRSKRSLDSARKNISLTPKSTENSIDDDMSLDLSQVSDFEDTSSKYGFRNKQAPLVTSTPKRAPKHRSSSLQKRALQGAPRGAGGRSCSRDNLFTSPSSGYRNALSSDLDFSSISPEGSSSVDTPSVTQDTLLSPPSREQQDYSCVSTWQERSAAPRDGEWAHFWADYSGGGPRAPVGRYYDQCPTPYRTEDVELADLEFPAESSRIRTPEDLKVINKIIRNDGLKLTPRETQNIIKCAHILGNVLTKAIDRQSKDQIFSPEKIHELSIDPEKQVRKKSMTLELKETVIPIEVKEEKRWESVPTQTDISLPNTKSAPKIFENILRQLSRSSLEDAIKKGDVKKEETKKEEIKKEDDKKEEAKNEEIKREEDKKEEAKDENNETVNVKKEGPENEEIKTEDDETMEVKKEGIKNNDVKTEEAKIEDSRKEDVKKDRIIEAPNNT